MMETNIVTPTSFKIALRMDHQQESQYYSFPLFIPDNNLLSLKIPVIAFLFDGELVCEPEKFQMTGKELVRSAFNALKNKTTNWQQHPANVDTPDFIIARAEEGESVAEKILDIDFMEQARLILRCEEMEFAVPHSGVIIACKKDPGAIQKLEHTVRKELTCPIFTHLSDAIFTYTNGQIVDVRNRKYTSPATNDDTQFDIEGLVLKVIKIPVFTGDFLFKVEIGLADDDLLLDLCEKAIFDLLKKSIQLKSFLGIIEFVISRQTNPYSPLLEAKLTRFWELLEQSQQLSELVKQLKKDVEVSILFGEHLAKGETYRRKYFKLKYVR